MFGLAEVFVVKFEIRRGTVSFSLSEIPLVLGLFFAHPTSLVLGQTAGAAAALALHRRQKPIKLWPSISASCRSKSASLCCSSTRSFPWAIRSGPQGGQRHSSSLTHSMSFPL
jgi:hypothetical protein